MRVGFHRGTEGKEEEEEDLLLLLRRAHRDEPPRAGTHAKRRRFSRAPVPSTTSRCSR
jgi:hypothetical protein